MRKVLSFVLVLSLVLSSFSMAFAADSSAGLTDIAGNANEDAIQVAYDLGIVTGNPDMTFAPDKAVNRAEFAAMITRALNIPDSALAGYTTTTFKDTVGYGWAVPYLAFCQSKGIMLGDGNGNVMPGRTITVNEAMTMALRAIGYTANSALLVGVWPSNYVSIAQNNDLYDDVAKETTVNKASAAQIIYNLLTVQKVAVNTDGTTDLLWVDGDEDGEALNLLNSNLGCTSDPDVILGDAYDYDDAIINITDDIGAFGTAYLNEDDELVAFTKDSTALTGKVNDDQDKFEVGDVEYDIIDGSFTPAAVFANTDADTVTGDSIDVAEIVDYAAANSDDGDTVTLYVDLSGKKIKDIYSVVAWKADDALLASDDVQEAITEDKELETYAFAQTDDDEIDMNSFQLVGVASLDKIAEDNVLYIYTDGDDIRKIAVGTETVEGTVEELNDDFDVVTIGDKDYDVSAIADYTFDDNDIDADGVFYLDVDGKIFDFDGTSSADTFGVVKAASEETDFDNYKVKLYMSDDSTDTLYLSESNPKDIEWVSTSATTIAAVTKGALIGYSLDSNGDIDTIDNTFTTDTGMVFKSKKVIDNLDIDSQCVVFTYNNTMDNTSSYDVATLDDIDANTTFTSPTAYILNEDGDVVALFIEDDYANTEDDAIYGVINTRSTTKNDDGDKIYKFKGFIDGAAFTYMTDDDVNDDSALDFDLAGLFGVYAITLDSNDNITTIAELAAHTSTTDSKIVNATDDAEDVTALAKDNTVITTASGKYTVAEDAVVYKFDEDDTEFSVSKLSAIDEGDTVTLYDTKGEDVDGVATVVIYIAN